MEWSGEGKELFDTLINFDKSSATAALRDEGLLSWHGEVERVGYSHYDIVLFGDEKPDLHLELHYAARVPDSNCSPDSQSFPGTASSNRKKPS